MQNEIKKWWEETSGDYQQSSTIPTDSIHYGPYSPTEEDLKLLGDVTGKHILELGCGGGQCSIAFAKKGACIVGIDISKNQLEYAQNLASKNKVKVKFIQSNFMNLKDFRDKSFDIVFSAYALEYASNLLEVFKEVERVLKKRGLFVFSFDHPFYLILDPHTKKIRESYFDAGKKRVPVTWKDGSKQTPVYYKYKVSDIFNALVESGLTVEKILEPLSFKNQKAWTKGIWQKIYPKDAVKLVGPTVIFKAKK